MLPAPNTPTAPASTRRPRLGVVWWLGDRGLGTAVMGHLDDDTDAWRSLTAGELGAEIDAGPVAASVIDASALDREGGWPTDVPPSVSALAALELAPDLAVGPPPAPDDVAPTAARRVVVVMPDPGPGPGLDLAASARLGAATATTRALALRLAPTGTTVNAVVVPAGFPSSGPGRGTLLDGAPTIADLCHVLCFLLDPENGYVTGQTISLLGGADAWHSRST